MSLDALFDKIDETASKLEKQAAANGGKKKTGGGGGGNFKNVDMTFLGMVTGTYEMKFIPDSTGALSEDVLLHSVKTNAGKVTVPCSGEGCSLCAYVDKLEQLKNKGAWKFKPYKTNKIFVKIGDGSQSKDLKTGGVYVAYVDDTYFKNLMSTLKNGRKYFEGDIAKMLDPAQASAGILVSASLDKKRITQNFNFINTLSIPALDVKEVFGVENYKLANFGYFRNNYIDANKLATAEGYLKGLLLATAEKAGKKVDLPESSAAAPASGDEKKTDAEPAKQEPVAQQQPDPAPVKTEDKVAEPAPTPVAQEVKVEEQKIIASTTFNPETDERTNVIPSGSSHPACFSYFDPTNPVCSSQCASKRECLIKTMDEGRV